MKKSALLIVLSGLSLSARVSNREGIYLQSNNNSPSKSRPASVNINPNITADNAAPPSIIPTGSILEKPPVKKIILNVTNSNE